MTNTYPPLVLHVIHHLHIGGMENGLVNLINTIPASRYRHAIACIEDASDFRRRIRRPDVEIIELQRSKIGIWRLRRELWRLCRRLKPAIVHSRNQSGLDALLPARLAGVAHCIHGEHGWDVDNIDGKHWKPRLLRQLHSPLIDRYITVSADLKNHLINQVGIAPARIAHICNGVDTERFAPPLTGAHPAASTAVASPVAALSALGLDDNGLILIGAVGRIQPVKDQATLLRAFAELVRQRPQQRAQLRLVIVGGGPLLADLRALADTLAVADLCCFPGAVDTVPELLRHFYVFALPSLNEGISNTILEAMACGVPVVATAVGGNVELIADGETGQLFAPGDVGQLTQILATYIDSPEKRHRHSQNARHRALENYSLTAMASHYAALYDSLYKLGAGDTAI